MNLNIKSKLPKYVEEEPNKFNTNTNSNLKNNDTEFKIKKVIYYILNKNEIPITREVRVPSIEIPYEIIKTKKRLVLTVIEAKHLTEGTILRINPGGLEGSERMGKDGIITFGTKNVKKDLTILR